MSKDRLEAFSDGVPLVFDAVLDATEPCADDGGRDAGPPAPGAFYHQLAHGRRRRPVSPVTLSDRPAPRPAGSPERAGRGACPELTPPDRHEPRRPSRCAVSCC
jgi:hypothetical protein